MPAQLVTGTTPDRCSAGILPNAASLTLMRDGKAFGSFYAVDSTPEAAGDMLRKVTDVLRPSILPTDEIRLSGFFKLGQTYAFLFPACTISGNGPGATVLHTACKIDSTGVLPNETKPSGTPGFIVGSGTTTIQDLTLVNQCFDPNEDGGLLGNNNASNLTLNVRRCVLDGRKNCDWVLYSWSGGTKTITVEDCDLYFARQGVSMCGSGDNAHVVTVRRCRFFGDANGSTSFGESSASDPVTGGVLAGIVLRGGTLTADDNEFWLTGLAKPYTDSPRWGCPRLACVTDQYWKAGRPDSKFVLNRNIVRSVTPGITQVVNDFDVRAVKPVIVGVGSNPDGTYKVYQGAK